MVPMCVAPCFIPPPLDNRPPLLLSLRDAWYKVLGTKYTSTRHIEDQSEQGDGAMTDLAVISRKSYQQLRDNTEDEVTKVLRGSPASRSEAQMDLLHALFCRTRFFRSISSRLIEKQCCRAMGCRLAAPGEVLFQRGDREGEVFYIIVRGRVKGQLESGQEFELGSGESFGELAVSGATEDERVRSATITCLQETLFATLSRLDYLRITGSLQSCALAVLAKPPAERTLPDVVLLKGFLQEVTFLQDMVSRQHQHLLLFACASDACLSS